MNIGIITFQYSYNFGAVLQLAALQKVLKELGHASEAINYFPQPVEKTPIWKNWGIRSGLKQGKVFENIISRWIEFRNYDEVASKFQLFTKENIKLSDPCHTNEEIKQVVSRYDAVISGSDQVWQFNKPSPYFLDWGSPYEGQRISYAPSCGSDKQPRTKFKEVGQWIQNIDFLSVRDEVSKKVVQNVSGRTPEIVADPTLLTDLEHLEKSVDVPSNYIFAYILGKEIHGTHEQMIKEIRKKYGDLPVVAVVASAHKPKRINWAEKVIFNAGPGEWLYLVANASFVYTDSFHCSLQANSKKIPFLSYYAERIRAPRLLDLKKRYGMEKSIAGSVTEAIKNKFWEQENTSLQNQKINRHVKNSLNFLQKALSAWIVLNRFLFLEITIQ